MKQSTKPTKISEISRNWHLVDVKDTVLGRAATGIAVKLMGKSKPYFAKNLDCGDFVVVINSRFVRVTGKKEKEKLYSHYSGHPGGLKQKALWQVRAEKPTEPIIRAVYGMLPKNKLRDDLMKRLYVYPDADHAYSSKFETR